MNRTADFDRTLAQLRDTSRPYPAASLFHFSDLSSEEAEALEAIWPEIEASRRLGFIQDLNELSEANFEVSFEAVFRIGLEDESPDVRATSIRGLWEAEAPDLIELFIDFMENDPELPVRSAAASALGRFVYLGELEELPEGYARRVENALLDAIHGDDDLEVRRRALEALSYSSRPEIPSLIAEAYDSSDQKMRVSAVFAMGRNADRARWQRHVRAELDSSEPEMRFEAARAAGELELVDAGPQLAQLLDDDDTQVRDAAIWSLSQVGGDYARDALTDLLERTDDEDEQDYISDALDNLAFTNEVQAFSIFELGGLDDDDDDDLLADLDADLDDDLDPELDDADSDDTNPSLR